jgi:hypothetical protein
MFLAKEIAKIECKGQPLVKFCSQNHMSAEAIALVRAD